MRPGEASSLARPLVHLGTGFGLTALLFQILHWARATEVSARSKSSHTIAAMSLIPLFIAASISVLGVTQILHPTVFDASAFMVDSAFFGTPSFSVAASVQDAPWFKSGLIIVYMHLPAACAALYALGRSEGPDRGPDILRCFLTVGVAGFVLYNLLPIVGPSYFFRADFPLGPPEIDAMKAVTYLALPEYRNCFPSLHTAWALVLALYGMRLGRTIALLAWAFALFTIIATVGLGLHYVVDLLAALPLVALIRAWLEGERLERRRSLIVSAGLLIIWFVAVRYGATLLRDTPAVTWILSFITIAAFVWSERRGLDSNERSEGSTADVEHSEEANTSQQPDLIGQGLTAVFFVSGFAALVYQVVFAKTLGLTFGSMGAASATVLTAYMAGIAIGSWVGGNLAHSGRDPIKVYVYCEIGIAVWCALTPVLFDGVQELYVSIASGGDPASPHLVALQLGLGLVVLMPPTILMGMTMPVLTAHFAGRTESLGRSVGRLYGANTLGAAAGAILTGYLLLPSLGTFGATGLAVLLNLAAGLIGLRLAKGLSGSTRDLPEIIEPETQTQVDSNARTQGWIAVAVLTIGGVLTLALETTYVHLLAVVAGNSAYAFSLMLFCFLLGLGGGAALSRNLLRRGVDAALGLAVCQLLLAVAIVLGLYYWDQVPAYFESFAQYADVKTFEKREFVRFVTCALSMLPVSLFIGAGYPFAMEIVGHAWPSNRLLALGRAAAANTAGNIIGALVGGFVLIPALGSFSALELMAGVALVLSGVVAWSLHGLDRRYMGLALVAVLALFPMLPNGFDMNSLASGANVYFHGQSYGEVVDYAESLDGGLTTVSHLETASEGHVYTLLTNGKFQGDSSEKREMRAQVAFGLTPLLHTDKRGRGLVIGFGTGVTARAVHESGFKQLDVVELSEDLLSMANRYFKKKNGAVLEKPGVNTYVTDGRNFLLLTKDKYDLVSIEVSSIWFAGAAALYNHEFYELVTSRLEDTGVLQQWIQLHRLTPEHLVSIIATLRNHFEKTWLYVIGGQGVLIGCRHECNPSEANIEKLAMNPGLSDLARLYKNGIRDLAKGQLLSPKDLDRFLIGMRAEGLDAEFLISTDSNHLLEYATPRANVRPYRQSLEDNLRMLRSFRRQPSAP